MGGNLNIINQWGELQKGGETKFFKFNEGEEKDGGGGIKIFDLNLVGGNYDLPPSLCLLFSTLCREFPSHECKNEIRFKKIQA